MKPFIYIKPQKTATKSIRFALSNHTINHSFDGISIPHVGKIFGHKSFNDYKIINKVHPIKDILFFISIRNPWDRYISWYMHHSKGRMSFDEFIFSHRKSLCLPSICSFVADMGDDLRLHYIRFESLQGDFDDLCDILNIPRQTLPHYHRHKRSHYSSYYNTDTRNFIAKQYKQDIERFKYKFESK